MKMEGLQALSNGDSIEIFSVLGSPIIGAQSSESQSLFKVPIIFTILD